MIESIIGSIGDLFSSHIWYDLKALKKGQIAEISVTIGAKVKLMTYDNFTQYRNGLPYKYFGGKVDGIPVQIVIPFDGFWILVVDSWMPFKASRVTIKSAKQSDDEIQDPNIELVAKQDKSLELKLDEQIEGVKSDATAEKELEESSKQAAKIEAERIEFIKSEAQKTVEIWTEGPTDAKLLIKAFSVLNIDEAKTWSIRRVNINRNNISGADSLLTSIQAIADNDSITNKIIIAMFDRDLNNSQKTKLFNNSGANQDLLKEDGGYVQLSNMVYAFAIPTPSHRQVSDKISIEHYFADDKIRTVSDGKRLFMAYEFDKNTGYSLCKKYHTNKGKSNNPLQILDRDQNTDLIEIDTKESCLQSKSIFADLVVKGDGAFGEFKFGEFQKIADVISKILNSTMDSK